MINIEKAKNKTDIEYYQGALQRMNIEYKDGGCKMTTHFLSKITDHRYKVVTDTGVSQHNLCEIAQYLPIEKWYLVKKSLNYELSEQALKFIYESVKQLNGEV